MPSYEVKLNKGGVTLKGGHDVMYVEAADAADARSVAAGYFDGDSSWANADVTEIVVATDLSPVVAADGKSKTWKVRVNVSGDDVNSQFEYECIDADSVDDMWAALPAIINADAGIASAAWVSPNLTVADVADDIGDHTVVAEVLFGDAVMASFTGAITHEGIPGAALSVAAVAAPVIPNVLGSAKS